MRRVSSVGSVRPGFVPGGGGAGGGGGGGEDHRFQAAIDRVRGERKGELRAAADAAVAAERERERRRVMHEAEVARQREVRRGLRRPEGASTIMRNRPRFR